MKNLIKTYFHYTKAERNGAIILLILSISGFIAPVFFPYLSKNAFSEHSIDKQLKRKEGRPVFAVESQALISPNEGEKKNSELLPLVRSVDELPEPKLVPFDPNTAEDSLLLGLGFSPKLVQTLQNYRQKGGRFRKKEDLKKLYGLSQEQYQQLLPYVRITKSGNLKDKASWTIDINRADTLEWQKLYGIGPAYARRINRFRDALGGFYNIDQVAATYGLPDSTFQHIKPQLVLSPLFRHLRINQADEETLKAHPYINWKQARILIKYSHHNGPYNDLERLKGSMAFSAEELSKLEPYLKFD